MDRKMTRDLTAHLEVIQPGIGTTVQDAGRAGHRHHGIPLAGWLDAPLAHAANALAGNALHEAVLEMRGLGTVLQIQSGPVRIALTGSIHAKKCCPDGTTRLVSPWQTTTLQTGDRLTLGPAESGCAYLAISGGLKLPQQLGSRSSYWRAGLEGVQGRAWRPGDLIPCAAWPTSEVREWRSSPWTPRTSAIRVMLGPQDDCFTTASLTAFTNETWEATVEQDRMGLRLRGEKLDHINSSAADIVSDAVTPGTIQVPASGQPIVLLADCQTVGGYPKIATVITADLPILAHARAGTKITFQVVTSAQAHEALLDAHQTWQQWLTTRQAFLPIGFVDEQALYTHNLISGMLLAEY
jgi:allophanate hydrolase